MYGIPFEEMAGVKHGWPYARNGAIPYKYQKIYIKHPTKIVQPSDFMKYCLMQFFQKNNDTTSLDSQEFVRRHSP